MLDFYYWPTPNGWKVAIMLEELGLDYNLVPLNIGKGSPELQKFIKGSRKTINNETPIPRMEGQIYF